MKNDDYIGLINVPKTNPITLSSVTLCDLDPQAALNGVETSINTDKLVYIAEAYDIN